MTLTDGEKIIIALLVDIHKALKVEGETDVNYLMEAIYSGNLWSLDWEWKGLLGVEETSEDVAKETAYILDMWKTVECSFNKLDDPDQAKVVEANSGRKPRFSGFDGNHDPHFGVMKHFIEVMNHYSWFKDHDRNSHSPVLDKYRAMLSMFDDVRSPLGDGYLSADELIQILRNSTAEMRG